MCGSSTDTAHDLRHRDIRKTWQASGAPVSDADSGAGPETVQRSISLSDAGFLPKFCCWIPGLALFFMLVVVMGAALVSSSAFYAITAVLTIFTLSYSSNLSVSCAFGAFKMRSACREDWDRKLQELQHKDPSAANVMHIVILPNYQEDEHMLQQTLENLGRSAMASSCMRVVLAMEGREGIRGQQKAERLIQNTRHLFSDIIAAYHPAGLSGEIAGKSSNTQWAYRAALQRWRLDLASYDASKVFLTVGDADTLWHPQFFSALSCEGLALSESDRAWSIWQPPVLLLRNLFAVPGPTRVSGYATVLFELAGLANQYFGTHFCYSAYSMSLALASHALVNGWDADVIAEDHHMFCKCYFASIWDSIEANRSAAKGAGKRLAEVVPKTQLRPVFLPAISYLVESTDGWVASVWARFQQARRHSQGIAELSYVLLRYAHLVKETGLLRLPVQTHAKVLGIAVKMGTVHIVNQVQAAALVIATLMLVPGGIRWIYTGGLAATLQLASNTGYFTALCSAMGGLGGLLKYLLAIFGPIPPMGLLMTVTTWLVVMDVLEGRLTQIPGKGDKSSDQPSKPHLQGVSATKIVMDRVKLFLQIQTDYFSMAHFTLLAYGLLPVSMAAWSLLRRGHKFEYIVAAKPR
jgi:hypothetical protein